MTAKEIKAGLKLCLAESTEAEDGCYRCPYCRIGKHTDAAYNCIGTLVADAALYIDTLEDYVRVLEEKAGCTGMLDKLTKEAGT
jgi:hypothetical protein